MEPNKLFCHCDETYLHYYLHSEDYMEKYFGIGAMAGLLGMKTAASFASKYKKKIKPLQHESLRGRKVLHDQQAGKKNGKAMYWKIGQVNNMLKQWQVQSRWSYRKRLDQAYTFARMLPGIEIVPCEEEQVFYLAESTFGEGDAELTERDLQGDFAITLEDPKSSRAQLDKEVHVVSSSSEEECKNSEAEPKEVSVDPVLAIEEHPKELPSEERDENDLKLKRKSDQINDDPTENFEPKAKRRLFLPLPFGGLNKAGDSPRKTISLSLKKK